jgi:hypothetical protein
MQHAVILAQAYSWCQAHAVQNSHASIQADVCVHNLRGLTLAAYACSLKCQRQAAAAAAHLEQLCQAHKVVEAAPHRHLRLRPPRQAAAGAHKVLNVGGCSRAHTDRHARRNTREQSTIILTRARCNTEHSWNDNTMCCVSCLMKQALVVNSRNHSIIV